MVQKKLGLVSVFFLLVMSAVTLLAHADSHQHTAIWIWEARASVPTSGGYGEAVVGAQGKVYLLRCLYATRDPELYVYNPASDNWELVDVEGSVTGTFRNGTSLAWDEENLIYALAGARYKDSDRRDFWLLHLDQLAWERGPDTPYAQGAGNALTWSSYDRMLYAFVGSREHNGGRSYFIRYSPVNHVWETLPSLWQYTEDGASLAAVDEYIYALQGEISELQAENNMSFARYHIPSGTWEVLPPIPDPGGVGDGGSLLWLGQKNPDFQDYIIALGGGSADETPGNGVYLYSIRTQTWVPLADLPCSVGYYVGNRLAVAGGRVFYWQGERRNQPCNGRGFYELVSSTGADLAVRVIDCPNNVRPGALFSCSLEITNQGPLDAQTASVTLSIIPATIENLMVVQGSNQYGPIERGSVIIPLGTLSSQYSVTLKVEGLMPSIQIEIQANVNSSIVDPVTRNNSAICVIPTQPTTQRIGPGDVVIVCVLANAPGRYEIPAEWIGLLNVSQHRVNLRGCQICDEQACWTVPYDVFLNPDEAWRVYGSEYNPSSSTRGIALRNKGETVSIFFEGALIDEWRYPGGSEDGEVLTRPRYLCPW